MLITITNDKDRYDLFYWNVEVLGGVQYQVSEEQLKQIQNCDYTQVQSVIRQIVANCERVFKS